MSFVVSFHDFTPTARYDAQPWTEIRVEEGADATVGPWTVIDTIAISPVDPDPSQPASRSFTTENGTAADLWYRITFFDALGGQTEPTVAQQNIATATYATVAELFRILKIRTPSEAQTLAAEADLSTATIEINHEIDLAADAPALTGEQLNIARGVCLDRAADLWRHRESAAGMLGIPDETIAAVQPMRYSWTRYAQRLSPLKNQWGFS